VTCEDLPLAELPGGAGHRKRKGAGKSCGRRGDRVYGAPEGAPYKAFKTLRKAATGFLNDSNMAWGDCVTAGTEELPGGAGRRERKGTGKRCTRCGDRVYGAPEGATHKAFKTLLAGAGSFSA
jgi:hypothetical protein